MECGGFVHLGLGELGLVCWWSLAWDCCMVFVGGCGWLPWTQVIVCYFVTMVAPCACSGHSVAACWIRASVGRVVAVCSCCFGCMQEACACFVAARWVVFASDVHCVVVFVEMDARYCGF